MLSKKCTLLCCDEIKNIVMNMSLEAKILLKDKILQAFGDVEYPGDDKICSSSAERVAADPELQRFLSAFRSQHWKNISPEIIKGHATEIPFFTPEAFRFFIPAYLLTALDNFACESPVFAFTIYALNPADSEGRISHAVSQHLDQFSLKEALAIVAFLKFAMEIVPEAFKVDQAAEALDNYWLKRCAEMGSQGS